MRLAGFGFGSIYRSSTTSPGCQLRSLIIIHARLLRLPSSLLVVMLGVHVRQVVSITQPLLQRAHWHSVFRVINTSEGRARERSCYWDMGMGTRGDGLGHGAVGKTSKGRRN